MPGYAKTPGYDGPEGTPWGDEYRPGRAEWVETAPADAVADDNKPCNTCGKVHGPDDASHSEEIKP